MNNPTTSYFLGPKSEQRRFFLETLETIVQDYLYWRINYHPKDPPPISLKELNSPEASQFKEKFVQELFHLISDLKLDIPFFSPRYMAHIVSETSLPGLIAYIATLLYNPNNVSPEAAPVTTQFEIDVGKQFAELFELNPKQSFGHLTSGGTIANYEAFWYHKNSKYFPLTCYFYAQKHKIKLPFITQNLWELYNLPLEKQQKIVTQLQNRIGANRWSKVIEPFSINQYGDINYHIKIAEHFQKQLNPPIILIPETAHYCILRASTIFGIGLNQFIKIKTNSQFQMDTTHLKQVLSQCLKDERPILMAIVVAGTTEFGTIDPINKITKLRDEFSKKGLYFPIHVDAAFGGYFATMFKHEGKSSLKLSPNLKKIENDFRAIKNCESITIDPHKMGFTPYGAGSIIFKHGFVKHLIARSGPYIENQVQEKSEEQQMARYIFEGSKPGAAAASVWFSHKMIPLNQKGYGSLLNKLCDLTQLFYQKILKLNQTKKLTNKGIEIVPLFKPQTNVLAFVVLTKKVKSLNKLNQLNRSLYHHFGIKKVPSIQSFDYLVSHTQIAFGTHSKNQSLSSLKTTKSEDYLEVIRLVLMNQWIDQTTESSQSYMDEFLGQLTEAIPESYLL